jgi:hypothetical protein
MSQTQKLLPHLSHAKKTDPTSIETWNYDTEAQYMPTLNIQVMTSGSKILIEVIR